MLSAADQDKSIEPSVIRHDNVVLPLQRNAAINFNVGQHREPPIRLFAENVKRITSAQGGNYWIVAKGAAE